jgi:thiamine kinase-like enzyme
MGRLWRLSQLSGGALSVPRPVAHLPELGLVLQEEVPGTPVGSARTRPEFADHVRPAARALAVIHDSGIEVADDMQLTDELDRLDGVVSQLALVHPPGHFLLRELLLHVRARLRRTAEEEFLPTHGDCKYDQFLHLDGVFSLIDFDYFGMAETSYDLGKYCAYLVPSQPRSWEDSAVAEEARRRFLSCYLELRPHATIQRFPIYEAVNLANRAMTLMWAQTRGWEQAADGLLALAMERLNSRLPV